MRILVADNEVSIGNFFKTVLNVNFPGYVVDVVVNGAEVVEACRKEMYDVVLTDIRMPEKNGYRACMEISELCRQNNLKMPYVIFCTGYKVPEEVRNLVDDQERYALLIKPVSIEQLASVFKNVV